MLKPLALLVPAMIAAAGLTYAQTDDKAGESEAKALILKLADPRIKAQHDAVRKLAKIGGPAVPALIAALKDSNAQLRYWSACALGMIGDARAADPLFASLGDPDRTTRMYSAASLCLLEDERGLKPALDYMVETGEASDLGICLHLSRALAHLGEPAIKPCIDLLDREGNPGSAAAQALIDMRNPKMLDPLLALLRDGGTHARGKASYVIASMGDKACEKLFGLLSSEDDALSRWAVITLGACGDKRAIRNLVHQVRNPDRELDVYVQNALIRLGDSVIDPLVEVIGEGNLQPALLALPVLAQLGKPAWEALARLSGSPIKLISDIACIARANNGDASALRDLVEILKDEKSEIRFEVARALGRIGAPAIAPVLEALSAWKPGHVPERFPYYALDALVAIGEPALPELAKALQDEKLRDYARQALGRIGMKAEDFLVAALKDKNPKVRCAAVYGLSNLGSERVIRCLCDALNDEDKSVRYAASMALERHGAMDNTRMLKDLENPDPARRKVALIFFNSNAEPRAGGPIIRLMSDADPETRALAVGAIRYCKSEEAFQALLAAAEDRDAGVRSRVMYAFLQFMDPRCTDTVIKALSDPEPKVRFGAVETFRKFVGKSHARAVEPLVAIMMSADRNMRGTVAELLVFIGKPAVQPLMGALGQKEGEFREDAAKALGEIGDPDSAPALIKALANCSFKDTLVRAIARMCAKSVKEFIGAVSHENAGVRKGVAEAFGLSGNRDCVEPLISLLGDRDAPVSRAACISLGLLKDERCVEALAGLLKIKDDSLRYSAAEALGSVGGEAALDRLAEALFREDGYSDFRIAKVLAAAGKAGFEKALSALRKGRRHAKGLFVDFGEAAFPFAPELLKDPSADIREEAARILERMPGTATLNLIAIALKDSAEKVRIAAAYSLSSRTEPEARDMCLGLLDDGNASIRRAGVEGLRHFTKQTPVEILIKALRDIDEGVRSSAATVLGGYRNDKAAEALIKALLDSDYVRDCAARSLGEMKDPRAIGPLMHAAMEEGSHSSNPALNALNSMKGPYHARLLEFIRSGSDYEAYKAAFLLYLSPDPSLVPALETQLGREGPGLARTALALLCNRDSRQVQRVLTSLASIGGMPEQVKDLAARALQRFESPTINALIDRLAGDDAHAADSAADLLGRMRLSDTRRIRELAGNTDPLLRRRAVVSLGVPREDFQVDFLSSMLPDSDAGVRAEAVGLLGRSTNRRSPTNLNIAVLDGDPGVRLAAVRALAETGTADEKTIYRALGDRDVRIRRAGSMALVRCQCRVADPELRKLLANRDPTVRANAAVAVSASSWIPVKEARLLLESGNRIFHEPAAYALRNAKQRGLSALLAALFLDCSSARHAAARALGSLGSSEAVPPLMSLLEDERFRWGTCRMVVCEALGGIGEPCIAPLIKDLSSPDPVLANDAAVALACVGRPAREPLIDAMRQEPGGDDLYAAVALGRMGDKWALKTLLSGLSAGRGETRRHVVRALCSLGDHAAFEPLAEISKTGSAPERAAVAEFLPDLGFAGAGGVLAGLLGDSDPAVRERAAASLGRCGTGPWTEALGKALHGDASPQVRAAAASSLGVIRDGASAEPLAAALKDDSPAVRAAAAASLAGLGGDKATAALRPYAGGARGAEREDAMFALAEAARDGESLVFILESSLNPDPLVRSRALRASSGWANGEIMRMHIRCLEDDDIRVRRVAAEMISPTCGMWAYDALSRTIYDHRNDRHVRLNALAGLLRMSDRAQIRSMLLKELASPDSRVRSFAAAALGSSSAPEAILALMEALRDTDLGVRMAAADKLKKISGRDLPRDREAWNEWFKGTH